MGNKVYSGIDKLPSGNASDDVINGCIVLEGGGFRGIYTSGVLDALRKQGKLFVISPSAPITVSRVEGDMEKLGQLYYMGYNDGQNQILNLKEYLNIN